ncbi:hypothetical protein NIES3806_40960 [Microcystis aeruginosa NIES-3806]|uniref:Uncharacterized protein n=1 Tax=Microcystis aeruginosa NIES-3807 TaxID=2517785 RepID=A0AAD3AWP5_MICAE|nr:hypothetical protein NIES3806_40960 [Microcystis aeruginosa NIES-3806]GCL56862.1 hypothetical protein NIES3807_00080 [Microcystis aeruginosa NIES-3807]
MITDVSAAACKHLTEKLMRGGLGGRTPQKLGLRDKIASNSKSVEYRLHIRRGTDLEIEAEITPIRQSEYFHVWR